MIVDNKVCVISPEKEKIPTIFVYKIERLR